MEDLLAGQSIVNLELRWYNLWSRINATGNGQDIFRDLVRRYGEAHRFYHTLRHIEECFSEFDKVRHLADNPDAIELAIWFHDSIYETRQRDSEERSAKLASGVLNSANVATNLSASVEELILSTKHTKLSSTFSNKDIALLIDIDLAILGQTKERFDEYEGQIRKEYGWVSSVKFAIGRSKLLTAFLTRPRIYSTTFFSEKYEKAARKNINRSLNQWSYPVRLIISLINKLL